MVKNRNNMTENAKGLVDIGKLVLSFAKVNRVTRHEDGIRPESDTDHTVMLSVCSCALAKKLYPELDLGKVAQFAIVHDLVEAYAMDTDSFGITAERKKEKDDREHEAFLRIEREFKDVFPWIVDTMRAYEERDSKEARFVKTLDKVMPKITHILNRAGVFKKREETIEAMKNHFDTQSVHCEQNYAFDMPEVIALLREVNEEVLRVRMQK
jgi:putative hydrolases of HD superfamily